MIIIHEIPQRYDCDFSYTVVGDVLIINIDGKQEDFDFSNLPDGILESIEVESISLNPILKAEKQNAIINIDLNRFYNFNEKHLFEAGGE